MFNALGENVYRLKPEAVNSKPEIVIDVSSFSKGIYFLKMSGASGVVIRKIVVE
jgi:hypothetical protein